MVDKKINAKKGFTIIEVVLVLAIAGLIFLMVFVAFPALQRSQGDTQRRQDYAMLSSAITAYATNNNNKLDRLTGSQNSAQLTPASEWINKTGEDPDRNQYVITVYKSYQKWSPRVNPEKGNVYVIIGAECGDGSLDSGPVNYSVPVASDNKRAFAVFGYLESGTHTYCSDSQ